MPRALSLLGLVVVLALLLPGVFYASAHPHPSAAPAVAGAGSARPTVTGPVSGEWPTFRGSASRSGYTASDGPSTSNWLWVVPFPRYTGNPGAHLRTSPVILGNEVIAADDLGDVLALNVSDNGSRIWQTTVGIIPTGPTVVGGDAILGDASGGVTALNVSTGAHVWSRNFGPPVNQSVLVENTTGVAVTRDGTVNAFVASTGATLWATSLHAGSVDGAPAFDGSHLYVTTESGNVTALNITTGAVVWSRALHVPVATGAVAGNGLVLVAGSGLKGRLYAVNASDGALLWNWSDVGRVGGGGGYLAAPAMDATTAYLIGNNGGIFAVWLANGTTRWNTTPAYEFIDEGYPLTAPPVITPTALYLIDGLEQLDNFDPTNGHLRWSSPIGTTSYSPPAVAGDALVYGDDDANLYWVAPTHAQMYPVSGRVVSTAGLPLAGASVTVPSVTTGTTGPNGTFSLELANGSYPVNVDAVGYLPLTTTIVVAGPTSNLTFALAPVPLYPITGRVIDGGNARGLAGVPVHLVGYTYFVAANTVTNATGGFLLYGPRGQDYIAADPPHGYQGASVVVKVPAGGLNGIYLPLAPLGLIQGPPPWPGSLTAPTGAALIPLVALAVGGISLLFWGVSYQRGRQGLSTRVLSPFGRRLTMRLLLVPVQAMLLLAILFIFGAMFVDAARSPNSPCGVSNNACQVYLGTSTCGWNDASCVVVSFFGGWGHYVTNIFLLQWGSDAYGKNVQPVTQMLAWWVPPSLELAAFALAISVLIAYPIGLLAGWWADRPFDQSVRLVSLFGLLIPTFLVILVILLYLYDPFVRLVGDTPYGITPTLEWYNNHGGPPAWLGPAGNTLPTGFPLVDGILHHDWAFTRVVLAKTLLQASLIALVYAAIYLRYARHVVAERARSLPVVAARSRGVSERSLLWRHTAREVLPVFVLLFGITLPIYIGTQAVAEALFNDVGIGSVLLAEITNEQSTGFGISTAQTATGNLYQVTIFLLFFVVMLGSIASDAVAQWLDPRLARGEGGG